MLVMTLAGTRSLYWKEDIRNPKTDVTCFYESV